MSAKQVKILKQTLDYAHKSREEHLCFCPFCKHHKPKLSVNIEKNVFKCWVCDTRGKNIYYLIKRFGTFDNQQEWLRITNEVDVRDFELFISGSQTEQKVKQKIDLPDHFVPLWGSSSLSSQRPINYLKNRGISSSKLLEWKVGYCSKGEYKDRIVIPSFDDEGDINYFITRTFTDDWLKYKNPPVSKDVVFNELLIDWDEPIVLVEGVFDAVHEQNMIPILGSTLNEKTELFQKIAASQAKVYIALDPDAYKKEVKIIQNLLEYGLDVWKIKVPKGKDLGEISKYEYQRLKQNAEKVGFEMFFENIAI